LKKVWFLLILSFSLNLHAESMDINTHDMLIEKLELGNKVQQSVQINLRLADLYSDRSRLKQINEAEQKCDNCLKSTQDRKKSVEIYQTIFDQLENKDKERAFDQISGSSKILGQSKKAQDFYKKIISKKQYHLKLKAMAHLALAQSYFYGQEYKTAYTEYNKSIKLDSSLQTHTTRYQMSWCEFNMGQYDLAKKHLEHILSDKANLDSSLRVDISRDFAKFTAKGPINNSEIKKIHNLSPESEAKGNIEHLASELDRLDRAPENLIVNLYLLEVFSSNPIDKAMAYLSMAQAELTLKRLRQVPSSFNKSADNFKKVNCEKEELCKDYISKSKKFLIYWNKVEKDAPSTELNQVWQSYLQVFSTDAEMQFLGGQSLHKSKMLDLAVTHYLLAAKIIKNDDKNPHKKLFSVSLDASMAAAEESQNIQLKRKAYEGFLTYNSESKKAYEVRYQLAYLYYEEKKFAQALSAFDSIIQEYQKNTQLNQKVAKQTADLILDIYAINKDNYQIMTRSMIYAGLFSAHKKDFVAIYRKALINESLASLNQKDLKRQKENLDKMIALSFQDVKLEEQVLILETRVRLGQSTQDLNEVKKSSSNLVAIKKLNKKIRDFAYDKLIWASEMTLDFNKAFTYSKMSYSDKLSKNQIIKLAVLSELSGKNSNTYYEQLLDKPGATLEKNQIRAKIVQNSAKPWSEIKNRINDLKKSPQLLSELSLETYGRQTNKQIAEFVLTIPSVAKKPAGIILRRQLEIPRFKALEKTLTKHIISHRSDQLSQKGVAQRMEHLNSMERFANEAIKRQDFVLQASSLFILKVEKERFARDLTNLPLPKGLNAKEKQQYQSILNNKVASINLEAKKIETKLNEAWKNSKYLQATNQFFNNSNSYVQKVLINEAQFLSSFSPNSIKNDLQNMAVKKKHSNKDIQLALQKVSLNPFNVASIEKLRDLNRDNDNSTFVAYLDQRLMDLNKKVTP
jgi:tetratricopeptide (TPR) repeat protein